MASKKKSKLSGPVLFMLFSVVVGALGYWLGKSGMHGSAHSVPRELKTALLVFLLPAIFFVIAIHEAGHALVGVWVKFDFRLYVVGPFMWEKEAGNWKFKWNKNINTAGGLVMCLPLGKENLTRRFLYFVAGGPLASLILAGVAYLGYFIINAIHSGSLQLISYCLIIIALFSLVIFISTMVPLQMGGFASDGARILRLLRGGDTARFETLMIKIIADASGGKRPREYDLNELQEADDLAKKINAPLGLYIQSYLHQAYFDRGDLEKAEFHLMEYINSADAIPEGLRSMVWLDGAFFYAYAKKDLDTALSYWNRYTPAAFIPKAQVYLTEAAIGLLKNEKEVAVTKAEAAIKELPNMMDKGAAIALKEKLHQMLTIS